MTDKITFDFSEIDRLAADIGKATSNLGPFINSALHVSSNKIMKTWRQKLVGSSSLPALPRALSYDVTKFRGFGVSILRSEIGFDKGRVQGPLGNFSEYGSVNNPPRGFGLASLQENAADFEAGLQIAVADALREAGL